VWRVQGREPLIGGVRQKDMNEGWSGDDYLILFDEAESERLTEGYGVQQILPGLAVVGLLGWDDFILRNDGGQLFRAPTVPLDQRYVESLSEVPAPSRLTQDHRFTGKIKWYTQPIVFGGDPSAEQNIIWIDIAKHQELVQWWNRKYAEVAGE
jgi:hypothetical protein